MDLVRSIGRERGAVHIMVVILMIIVALVGWVLWYTANGEAHDTMKDAEKWKAESVAARIRGDAILMAFHNYSDLVEGKRYTVEVPPIAVESDWDNMRAAWDKKYSKEDSYKELATSVADGRKKFNLDETSYGFLLKLYNKVVTEHVDAKARAIEDKDAEIVAKTKSWEELNNALKESQDKLGKKDDEKNAEVAAKSAEKEEEKRRIDEQFNASKKQVEDLTGEVTKTKDSLKDTTIKLTNEVELQKAQVRVVNESLRIERERDKPDGQVIAVNDATRRCWINAGAKDLLRRGTRFKVYELGKGSVKIAKGFVVVMGVEADMAECAIEGGAGIGEKDYITSPIYSREGPKNFYFLGRLTGRFANDHAARIVESFGSRVQDKVTVQTDFLVIGDKLDPEGPELTESPEYTRAREWGVEIIRSQDLEAYLSL